MNLKPLYEEAHQFNYYNGTLLSDGKVEVWYLNRTRYADIYADVGGETPLPNPLELNNLGMQPVYVNPAFNYTIVVKDVYGNEIYSIDKYMQAEGEHNMTNVVVQPSETVGVSAWTEGEVQIYQPYLSGDLGKTYSGIDPIVVNNDENKISAETVSFGVQEPLFFVKDDEEGCIIGCSGVDSGASVVYQPYGSDAISGNLYMQQSRYPHKTEIMVSASGETKVVGIAPPVPSQASSTRLLVADSGSLPDVRWAEIGDIVPQPGQDYLPVSSFDDYSGQVSGQIDYVSANAGKTYSAGANIDITDQVISVTGLQPSGDYATKDDLESGLSGKMDKSESANFYPMEGNPSGFLTAETDWTDTITAASSYAYEQATAAIPAPQDLSYISGQVDSKLPTSAFSTVSGDFITALPADMATTGDIADLAESISETYQPKGDYLTTGDSAKFYTTANPSGFITGIPDQLEVNGLTSNEIYVTALVNPGDSEFYGIVINPNDISILDRDGNYKSVNTTAISDWNGVVNTVSSNSAAWAEGGVDSATVSAIASDYAESAASGKLDTTAFNSAEFYTTANPSGFITGVDLTPYQTTAGMTAYQPAGDYYSASNPSGFLTAETDWTDTITAASANAYEQATAAIPAPFDPSYISGQVDKKLDSAVYAADSGSFLTAHQSLPDSATWNTVTSKLDTTAFSTVSGSFITAHQSLPNSANWDSTYTTVNQNSASWTGGGAGIEYTGISPIVVNNSTHEISADTWDLAIGDGLSAFEDTANNQTVISVTATAGGGINSATVSAIASGYAKSALSSIYGGNGIAYGGPDDPYIFINYEPGPLGTNDYNQLVCKYDGTTIGTNNAGELTVLAAGGDVYVSGFEYTTGGDISGYSGSAFVGNDETFELSAGYGISLTTGADSLTISNTLTFETGSI